MRKFYPLILIFVSFLASCNGNGGKSDAYGNFEATEVMVSAENIGRLNEFIIDVGTQLTTGQIIGKIDSVQSQLKYSQLVAQNNSINAKLSNAMAQLKMCQVQSGSITKEKNRIDKLFTDSAATQQQLDDINGKYDLIKAQLEAANAQVQEAQSEFAILDNQIKQAKDMLSKCTIKNPIDGIVLERYADRGELVGIGVPLYKIADLSFLNLRAYLNGAQLSSVKIGQSVDILIDKGTKSFITLKGTITWISSEAEFTPKIIQTKDERVNLVYAIKVKVKNDGILKIGMPGEVRFEDLK